MSRPLKNKNDQEDELNSNLKKKKLDEIKNDNSDEMLDSESDDEIFSSSSETHSLSVGIKERINKNFKRFKGLIKQTPSDFIVNEVDSNGKVVRLTNFDLPIELNAIRDKAAEEEKSNSENFEENKSKLKVLVGDEKFEALFNLFSSNSKNETVKIEAPKEKNDRKLIHDFVKSYYKTFNSNTISDKETQFIEICHNKFNRDSMKDCYKNDNNVGRKEMGKYKYCECSLYKENIDTMQAINLISKNLRINQKRIGYAGTKDKKRKNNSAHLIF
jgi:tRNA pseudouridine13 synthase